MLGLDAKDPITTTLLLMTCGLLIVSFVLTKRGAQKKAADLVLLVLTIAMCVIVVESQGIQDPAVLGFPAIMLFASMFASRRAFLFMEVINFLLALPVPWASQQRSLSHKKSSTR